jgi:hypothetical protein
MTKMQRAKKLSLHTDRQTHTLHGLHAKQIPCVQCMSTVLPNQRRLCASTSPVYIRIHPKGYVCLAVWLDYHSRCRYIGLPCSGFPDFARRVPPIYTRHGVVPLMVGPQDASALGSLELKNDLEKEREYVVSPQSQLSPPPP